MSKKNQIKSSAYYRFWGICTAAVVVGQIYVGTGYNNMSNTLERIFDEIEVQLGNPSLLISDQL